MRPLKTKQQHQKTMSLLNKINKLESALLSRQQDLALAINDGLEILTKPKDHHPGVGLLPSCRDLIPFPRFVVKAWQGCTLSLDQIRAENKLDPAVPESYTDGCNTAWLANGAWWGDALNQDDLDNLHKHVIHYVRGEWCQKDYAWQQHKLSGSPVDHTLGLIADAHREVYQRLAVCGGKIDGAIREIKSLSVQLATARAGVAQSLPLPKKAFFKA